MNIKNINKRENRDGIDVFSYKLFATTYGSRELLSRLTGRTLFKGKNPVKTKADFMHLVQEYKEI